MRSPGALRRLGAPVLLAAVLWAVASLSPGGFWIMDEAYAFLQVEALSARFELPPAVPFPGAEALGPEAPSLRPLPHHYGFVRDGRLFAQYSPLFPLLTTPLYGLFGRPGLFLLPAASCMVLLAALSRIRARAGTDREGPGLLLLVGTPLLFYSQVFWSHLPAMALCALAWLAVSEGRGRVLPLALVFAAGLMREECLVFVPLLLVHGWRRRPWAPVAAAAACALAFLGLQKLLTGEWLGTHLAASGTEQGLYGFAGTGIVWRKLFVLRTCLLSCLPGEPVLLQVVAGLGLWAVWAVSRGDSRRARAVSAAGLWISAALAVLPALRGFPLLSLLELKHPLVTLPVLWLAGRPGRDWIAPAAALAALLAVMDPMHAQDVAWGSRLLLPPLVMLAAVAVRPLRRAAPAVLPLLVVSAVSVGFLEVKRLRSERLVEETGRLGGAVIATSWELPGEFASLQAAGTPVVLADSTAELATALDAFDGLSPVIVSPLRDIGAVRSAAAAAGHATAPVFSVSFDPALEAVVLGVLPTTP